MSKKLIDNLNNDKWYSKEADKAIDEIKQIMGSNYAQIEPYVLNVLSAGRLDGLNRMYINISDSTVSLEIRLNKALMVLNDMYLEFNFTNDPSFSIKNLNKEAFKLLYGYRRLMTYIDISTDYIFECKKIIEKYTNN